jgi:CDI toxin RNase A-like protein
MAWIDPRYAAHQRQRWTRHDAHLWMRHDAHRFRRPAFEAAPPPPVSLPLAAEEKRADPVIEAVRLTLILHRLRRERATLLGERVLKAGFNADQPRVPAGNSDGGQWTNTEGGGGRPGVPRTRLADAGDRAAPGTVLSDANPDPIASGARYAQDTSRRYSVNLRDEEAPRGIGHAIREHVGRSDAELMAIARADWTRRTVGRFEFTNFRLAHGSFSSVESANDFVNRTLENDKMKVDRVASGEQDNATLDRRFGHPTGREMFRPTGDAEPYVRTTYGVRVVIRHDSRSERGYRVFTAFPINEDSKR